MLGRTFFRQQFQSPIWFSTTTETEPEGHDTKKQHKNQELYHTHFS